jgi:hypothetical protein
MNDEQSEALAEAATVALEPLTIIARELAAQTEAISDATVERAEDKAILAIMDLVSKAYKEGYMNGQADERHYIEWRNES